MDLSEFRPIPGIPDGYVSEDGVVVSARRKLRVTSQWINSNGYMTTKVGRTPITVHRAVALAWIGDGDSLDVNHIDGNKMNNHASNLEWCTRGANIMHSLRTGLHANPETPVRGTHVLTGKVIEFISQAEAGKAGFTQANVSKCIHGERRTCKGYTWELAA